MDRPNVQTRAPRIVVALILPVLLANAGSAAAADWWVDGAAGSDYASGSRLAPFGSIHRGLDAARPGDTVRVLPTVTYAAVYVITSGLPGRPVTLQGMAPAGRYVKVAGSGNFGIQVATGTSWITIAGFDVQATGDRSAIYISPGTTHITVAGNDVHDSGGAGIATVGTDYLTVMGNVVARNATANLTACMSGISAYQLRNTDGSVAIKNVIADNIVYGNTNVPGVGCADSDGNGIIIDDSRNTQGDSPWGRYPGRTLVTDNVVFGNGGRGIDVFESDNVEIVDNTLWHNNVDPFEASWKPGEIMLQDSGGVVVMNNVAWGDGAVFGYNLHAEISIESCSGGAIIVDNNVLWSDTGSVGTALFDPVSGSHLSTATLRVGPWGHWNRWANALFVDASADPLKADFRLLVGSPGVGLGSPAYTAPVDIQGVAAPMYPTVGAYEMPVP